MGVWTEIRLLIWAFPVVIVVILRHGWEPTG